MVGRMRSPPSSLALLASPAFIAALALLVVNDVALKPLFHNALTGKLSDFAGLFALTVFVAALWPHRRSVAGWLIAAAFTFWKTSYAEPLIEALNRVSPIAFGRTVDLTDLVALPMIPVAVWAAPRMQPWPLPGAAKIGLGILALVAFTATSSVPNVVRSTLDVSSVAVIDEAVLVVFFDEVAEEHGLRCTECDSLDEGRVYLQDGSRKDGPDALTVNFDGEQRHVFYTTSAFSGPFGGRGREQVLALSEDIRAGMQQRFPGVTAIAFADDRETALQEQHDTLFTVQLAAENDLSIETVEQAKRTFSSIVEEVVRSHALRPDEDALVYYAGRRFGTSAYDRDLILAPVLVSNVMLRVRVARQTANYAAVHEAINEELAKLLGDAFGTVAVTREDFPAE